MREMDAFEQAYKNGYAAGMKAAEAKIVRCKDCVYSLKDDAVSFYRCSRTLLFPYDDDFCSYGERSAV